MSNQRRHSYDAFLEHIHPEEKYYVSDAISTAIHSQAPLDLEYRILRNNEVRFIHHQAEVIFDKNNKIIGL